MFESNVKNIRLVQDIQTIKKKGGGARAEGELKAKANHSDECRRKRDNNRYQHSTKGSRGASEMMSSPQRIHSFHEEHVETVIE